MDITTKYIKIAENTHDKSTHIKIIFNYQLGGMNYFTGQTKKRGYYLTVVPVERGGRMEGFTAFSGVSELLHETARKSKSAETIAAAMVPAYEKMIVEYIANKYGYILEAV